MAIAPRITPPRGARLAPRTSDLAPGLVNSQPSILDAHRR